MASKTPAKRPREVDGDDGDAKRIRSNDGSPVPAKDDPKAALAARMAAMKAKLAKATGAQEPVAAAVNGIEAKREEAARKIADLKAKLAAQREKAAPQQQQRQHNETQQNIAELRAKAAEYVRQRKAAASTPAQIVSQRSEGGARGGLGVGLHPSLLATPEPSKAKGPKFSTTKGNRAPSPVKVNPYLAEEEDEKPRERRAKPLSFAPHGKYIAQAAALKQQAKIEEMKRRMALEAKQIAIEAASDKSFLVPAPPDIEWWDESLFPPEHNYDEWEAYARIETADSVITRYVQHPVPIQPPQDKLIPAPKPMFLTQKEQKKLRRQRRMADMKEEQAKIRLGLKEAPAPKVKKSNMMRVYGEQAVKDPTAVEARVNKEIAERAAKHERTNQERQLSKEERAEKLKNQQAEDASKGLRMAVFKVDNLSSGKHRYQIDVNAKQNSLTGIVILHPDMNLVIVEGGVHSVTNYKKLMLNRIKWAENTVPLSNNSNPTFTAAAMRDSNRDIAEGPSAVDTWLNPLTESGQLKDLSENRCLLVWEGEERQRSFRKWGSRVCETDGQARDTLGRAKLESMWATAKATLE